MSPNFFRFKQFSLAHDKCAHKIGTDGVLLGAWINSNNPINILDIGSGSGLISFILAQRFPNAKITGIEMDETSFHQSQDNLQDNPWKDRIEFIHSDFLKTELPQNSFDLIVSNPPFFKEAYLSGNKPRDNARHEFSLPHKLLINKAISLLKKSGKIALVLPVEEGKDILSYSGLHAQRVCEMRNKPTSEIKRYLMELSPNASSLLEEEIWIREDDGTFAEKYQNLTKDFYLKF